MTHSTETPKRDLLKSAIEECPRCYHYFLDHAPIFLDHEAGPLSEEQSEQLLIILSNYHKEHAEREVEGD